MKLTNTYLIGKHLPLLQGEPLIERCAMCGIDSDGEFQGLPVSDVIGDSFMSGQFLGQTNQICIYCTACLGKGQERDKFIKNFNFMATLSKLKIFKRDEMWDMIFTPPHEPFIWGITYSHKKHISFKAPINMPGSNYQIQTENYTVDINLDINLKILMSYMQNWYSVNKDTSAQPTWFTKDEIKAGTRRYGVVEKYGIDEYLREDAFLKKYRGTGLIDLLTFLLNKGPFTHRGYALQNSKGIVKKNSAKKVEKVKIGKQLSLW